MSDEWPEGRIEFTTVNAGNLRRLHFDVVQAIQAVDRETCTAVVIPGASTGEAARILRMIVDGEVNNAAAERERIVAWMRRMREDRSIPYDVRVTAVLFAQLIEQGKHLDPRCESSLVYERPHPPHAWVTGVADMWCPGFPEQTQLEET